MASKIATAYVQVMPSMDGVAAKVKSEFDGAGSAAGNSSGSKLGGNLVSTVKKVFAAAQVGKFIGDVLTAGGDLQQSMGGIETLFKDSADTVIANARKAYETAGMSANDYMENVTSFSASLISSLGGDTAAAVGIADRMMVDMSDNANKMGTDMEAITNAYQGFAKGNYTMLDNLKLGYGGTQAEMKRLIADAALMTEAQKELGITIDANSMSFDNVANAISVVQKNMGIAGATADEAAGTFSGSFNAMKASYQNLIGAMALGEDLTPHIDALMGTVSTFVEGNLLPMLGNIVSGMPDAIGQGVQAMVEWIGNPGNIADILSKMWDFGWELIGSVLSGLTSGLGNLFEKFPELFTPTNPDLPTGLPIPGAATGLNYVPYDDYLVRLHEGEMVLTRSQANAYRSGARAVPTRSVTVIQNIHSEAKTAADLMAAARYQQEMAVMMGV